MPIIKSEVLRLEVEHKLAMEESLRAPRPFFDGGVVETALTTKSESRVKSSTILSELEEEQEFERLILRMRSNMDISDRRAAHARLIASRGSLPPPRTPLPREQLRGVCFQPPLPTLPLHAISPHAPLQVARRPCAICCCPARSRSRGFSGQMEGSELPWWHFLGFSAARRLFPGTYGRWKTLSRVKNRVPYFKCFTGKTLVDFLVNELSIMNREEAINLGQRWMDAGVFYHVTRGEEFGDTDELFRFKVGTLSWEGRKSACQRISASLPVLASLPQPLPCCLSLPQEDEVGSILNMKVLYNGPTRSSAEIEAAFIGCLGRLYRGFTTDGGTLLDYEALALSDEFRDYCVCCSELQKIQLRSMSFSEKITFFINAFNGATHRHMLLLDRLTLCSTSVPSSVHHSVSPLRSLSSSKPFASKQPRPLHCARGLLPPCSFVPRHLSIPSSSLA